MPLTHEAVHLIDDRETGLHGVIALHSTRLGPAAGGCRLWAYDTHSDMVTDALRLSRGMSYKNAMAGLPFGGGKAVLNAPLEGDRRAAFLAFGRAVKALGGCYITAEDVGTTVEDMRVVREEARSVAGLPLMPGQDRAGGDPSPWTALGVFLAIEECVRRRLGSDLKGVTVAVQGLGNVGRVLCRMLTEAGAKLIVADPVAERVRRMEAINGARGWSVTNIHGAPAEVFAPCALGAGLTSYTIPRLHAKIVCGGANNQLQTDEDGLLLLDHGVLYAPDYVVNAGGIINVSAEYLGETRDDVETRVRQIPLRLRSLFERAEAVHLPVNVVADQRAEELICAGAAKRAA